MKKVLLVDDEPIFRMGLRTAISWETIGCQIIGEAKNGQEALIQIEEKRPDIVFLDIKMPKMSGIQVLEKRKKYKSNPKFVVLSCFNEYEYVREAMKLGACDYLFKPLMEGKDIEAVIREIQGEQMDIQDEENKSRQKVSEYLREIIEGDYKGGIEEHCPQFSKQYHFFLGIKIPGKKVAAQKKETMRTLCKEVLVRSFDDGIVPYFCEKEEILYGLFLFEAEDGYRLENRRKSLWKKIKEYVEIPVWVASSEPYMGSDHLPEEIAQIKSAMELHYFTCYEKADREFISYKPVNQEENSLENMYRSELEKICLAFGKNDKETIRGLLRSICGEILQNNVLQPKEFAQFLANIIIGNMRHYNERELLEQFVMGDYNVISNLYHQETMESACNYFIEFLDSIFQAHLQSEEPEVIQKSLEYIQRHYKEKIMLKDVADEVHLSVKYFCELFHETTGETFLNYLTSVRIQEAERLLKTTDLKNYEIGQKVGFGDYHHFCKTFKKLTGKTPSELRRK